MANTVAQLIDQAECQYGGVLPWGQTIPESRGGIYMIALSDNPESKDGMSTAPINRDLVASLVDLRPELTVQGNRPSTARLTSQLAAMWVPDEPVVYIGKATNLAARVSQYYTTKLGARSPHAGGWPLKVLSSLESMWVHWATSEMPELAEQKALAAFVHGISPDRRVGLVDPEHPYPYANLEGPGGRKRHGVRGARASRRDGRQAKSEASGEDREPATPAVEELDAGGIPRSHAANPRVTLHEEIAAILRLNGNRWMTTSELASEVAARQVYLKRNGRSDVSAYQIHGRTKNYPHLFDKNGSRVRLRRS